MKAKARADTVPLAETIRAELAARRLTQVWVLVSLADARAVARGTIPRRLRRQVRDLLAFDPLRPSTWKVKPRADSR